jgi:hypothetical protein
MKKICAGIFLLLASVAAVAAVGVVTAVFAALDAFAIHTIWGWFVTPAWGIAAPSLMAAWGLAIIVHLLIPAADVKKDKAAGEKWGSVIGALLRGPFAIAVAWVVLQVFA